MKLNKKDRLILHALKWIIERDCVEPSLRKEMDGDISQSIVDLLYPKDVNVLEGEE